MAIWTSSDWIRQALTNAVDISQLQSDFKIKFVLEQETHPEETKHVGDNASKITVFIFALETSCSSSSGTAIREWNIDPSGL
jgi:hypothetical protein